MLWRSPEPLVLGSASRARHAVLSAAGIPLEICPAEINEGELAGAIAPAPADAVAQHLALCKAQAVVRHRPGRLVLGADQTLALDQDQLRKPADRAEARAQLMRLAGRTHELYSAVALVRDQTVLLRTIGVARLTLRRFSEDFLEAYLDAAGDRVTESVGAYQLEGLGSQLMERVEGDHWVILGVPLLAVLGSLRDHGVLPA